MFERPFIRNAGSHSMRPLAVALAILGFAAPAGLGREPPAAEGFRFGFEPFAALTGGKAAYDAEPKAKTKAPPKDDWEKSVPLGFSIDYTLVSDYIWRGMNFSEFPGEGREKLNHQVGAGISLDLDEKLGLSTNLGTVGFSVWGEWYAANKSDRFNGVPNTSDTHLQEVDWTINWSYDVGETGVSVEAGWIAYEFPNAKRDAYATYEFYGKASFNDARILGVDDVKGLEDGIVSPSVSYYYDYDLVKGGWLEFGVEHGFNFPQEAGPLKHISITPSLALGVDNRYWDKAVGGTGHKSTRLATIVYGLTVGYDLGSALSMPAKYGSLNVEGFLNFSDALRADRAIGLSDELFGGVRIAYGW